MVKTPDGEIPFEYLSSGYRAVMYIILGIIKEVEYRDLGVSARGFDGVVLLDEVELHLHPEWQRRVLGVIRAVFPKIQLIVTTHSPHVVQSATPNQLIVLSRDQNGQSIPATVPQSDYGFQGWTIEEILTDVMRLSSTQSDLYNNTLKKFEDALDREDAPELRAALEILNAMLHPRNPVGKLLRLQAAPVLA